MEPLQAWIEAFTKAQAEFPDIGKGNKATIETRGGGSFSYSYADLPDVLNAIRPVLSKHGLSMAQSVTAENGTVSVETRIYHTGGHLETFGPLTLPGAGDARSAGSAITYARRYALTAALGIAPDEDDDGAKATEKAERSKLTRKDYPQPEPGEWLATQVAQFTKWDEAERKLQGAAAVKKVGAQKPMSMDEAQAVLGAMREVYYEAFPPADDEAPF